jgi:hypothetical protein
MCLNNGDKKFFSSQHKRIFRRKKGVKKEVAWAPFRNFLCPYCHFLNLAIFYLGILGPLSELNPFGTGSLSVSGMILKVASGSEIHHSKSTTLALT